MDLCRPIDFVCTRILFNHTIKATRLAGKCFAPKKLKNHDFIRHLKLHKVESRHFNLYRSESRTSVLRQEKLPKKHGRNVMKSHRGGISQPGRTDGPPLTTVTWKRTGHTWWLVLDSKVKVSYLGVDQDSRLVTCFHLWQVTSRLRWVWFWFIVWCWISTNGCFVCDARLCHVSPTVNVFQWFVFYCWYGVMLG